MNIYERIFARLEELHMSQIELSRQTGIATSTISDWRKKKINPLNNPERNPSPVRRTEITF